MKIVKRERPREKDEQDRLRNDEEDESALAEEREGESKTHVGSISGKNQEDHVLGENREVSSGSGRTREVRRDSPKPSGKPPGKGSSRYPRETFQYY